MDQLGGAVHFLSLIFSPKSKCLRNLGVKITLEQWAKNICSSILHGQCVRCRKYISIYERTRLDVCLDISQADGRMFCRPFDQSGPNFVQIHFTLLNNKKKIWGTQHTEDSDILKQNGKINFFFLWWSSFCLQVYIKAIILGMSNCLTP